MSSKLLTLRFLAKRAAILLIPFMLLGIKVAVAQNACDDPGPDPFGGRIFDPCEE